VEEIMGPLSQLHQKNTTIKYSTKGIKRPKASGRLKAIKSHEMGDMKYIKRVLATSLVKKLSAGLIVSPSQHAKRILPKEPRPKTSEGSKSIKLHYEMDSVTLCTRELQKPWQEVPAGAKSRDF
jgi:hypothetical protein